MKHDLVIIGAGPAGLAAALYAGRYRLNCLLIEKMSPGGQIILSADIENYPGFPGGLSTFELIDKFKKQVEDVGVSILQDEILEIKPGFHLKGLNSSYDAKSLIIATGAQPRRLNIEGEERFTGRGVSYCGTCDGPLFKNKEIAVIGGGDRALEEAIYLAKYAGKVTLIHRRDAFRGSAILEEKARANGKISFMLNSVIEKIEGESKVESIKVKSVPTGTLSEVKLQGVFIFVGIVPTTGVVKNLVELNEAGFIITAPNLKTSCEGVYACGDCIHKSLYQVVNACGEGAVAADSVHKYLMELR